MNEALKKAYALDAAGREAEAIPHYRRALAEGVPEEALKDALIGYASSLRVVGEAKRARRVLERARRSYKGDPAVEAFYALVLHDLGEHARALKVLGLALLKASSDPELAAYAGPLARYFRALTRRRRP